jgi:hypothetical protein
MKYGEKDYWGRYSAIQDATDRALIKAARGKKKFSEIDGTDHIEALAHAIGVWLGTPASSVKQIEDDIEAIAVMILEAALAHRNYLIEKGPWRQ